MTGAVRGTKRLLDSKSGCSTCSSHVEHEYPRTQGGGLAAQLADGALRAAVGSSSKPHLGPSPESTHLCFKGLRSGGVSSPPPVLPGPRRPCVCSAPGQGSWLQAAPVAHITVLHPVPCQHIRVTHCHSFLWGPKRSCPSLTLQLPWKLWVCWGPPSPHHTQMHLGGHCLDTGAKCPAAK